MEPSTYVRAVVAVVVMAGLAAPAMAQPYVYVLGQTDVDPAANRGPQYVTVINAATNARVTRITAGMGCQCIGAQGLTLSRDGAFVFVANEVDNSVSVVATANHTLVDTIPQAVAGLGPIALTVSPDNRRLFVLSGSGSVNEVDMTTRSRLRTLSLGVVQSRGMAVSPDGRRLFISTYGSNSVKVVDTTSFTVSATIPLTSGSLPLTVDVTPDGRFVYVAAAFINVVAVLDAQSLAFVRDVAVGARPYSLAVSPGSAFVYALNGNSASLSRISTTNQAVTATVSGVINGRGVAFTADGSTAWAVGSSVYAIATATNAVIGTPIPWNAVADGAAAALAVTPGPFTIPADPTPRGLAATVAGNRVSLTWTAPQGETPSGYVVEGGIGAGQVLASLPTGSSATSYAFDAPTGIFHVRVHALTAAGRSPASNEIQIAVNVPQPPAAPVGLLGLGSGSTLALSWAAATQGGRPTSFVLDVGGAASTSVPLGAGETFSFAGVPPGTYTFAVRAANAAGTSLPSAPLTLTFPATCPGVPQAPQNLQVQRSGRQLAVSWNPPATGPAVSGYVLKVTGALSLALPMSARTITGGVPPGTYNLSVLATNPCGSGLETPAQSVTVP